MRRPKDKDGKALEALAWRNAAREVFSPVVGALLSAGLDRDAIVEVLDAALIAAAGSEEKASRAGLPASARKRLRRQGQDHILLPLSYRNATRVISRWQLEPPFSEDGRPRALPLYGVGSFATLASMVGADPQSLLSQLKRVGAVRVTGDRVHLRENAYVPSDGALEKIDILGRDGAELLRAILHNIQAPAGRTMLQRRASYDNIGSAALKDLRTALRATGVGAVEDANRALAARDRDRNPAAPRGKRTRVSFAVYCFEEPVEMAAATRPAKKKRGRRS